jgi:hypothetical protein
MEHNRKRFEKEVIKWRKPYNEKIQCYKYMRDEVLEANPVANSAQRRLTGHYRS